MSIHDMGLLLVFKGKMIIKKSYFSARNSYSVKFKSIWICSCELYFKNIYISYCYKSACYIDFFLFCRVCFLGDRLLTSASVFMNGTMMCTKNESGPLYSHYCSTVMKNNGTDTICDDYFLSHTTRIVAGIPGLASDVFTGVNFTTPHYVNKMEPIIPMDS